METFLQAFDTAAPVWTLALERLSWRHGLVTAAYLLAAWFCLMNGHIARAARETHKVWLLAAGALCLLGANTLLQAEVLLTHVLRAIAKMDGWYGDRRELQYAVVGLLALLAWPLWLQLRTAFKTSHSAAEPVVWGLTLVLLVFVLRMVSAHGFDALLNLRLAGLSLGRLAELAGLGLVMHGCLRCLRLR